MDQLGPPRHVRSAVPVRELRGAPQWSCCLMVRTAWPEAESPADHPAQWCKESNGFDRLIPAARAMVLAPSCSARGDHCAYAAHGCLHHVAPIHSIARGNTE